MKRKAWSTESELRLVPRNGVKCLKKTKSSPEVLGSFHFKSKTFLKNLTYFFVPASIYFNERPSKHDVGQTALERLSIL